MKVLLVAIPYKPAIPIIPIGLLYIAQALGENGYEYKILDLNFCSDPQSKLSEALDEYASDVIGISLRNVAETEEQNHVYMQLKNFVGASKQYGVVILGGAGFSIFPKLILDYSGADFGVVGAGEDKTLYILRNLTAIKRPSIIYEIESDTDDILHRGTTESLKSYWNTYGKYYQLFPAYIPIQAVRGCQYHCSYCSYPIINRGIKKRDVADVIEEMDAAYSITKISHFYFVDSVFNMDKDYTMNLMKQLVLVHHPFFWRCSINPGNINFDFVKLMKESGCIYCEVGVDSFSDEVLKRLGKSFTSTQAIDLLQMLDKNHIPYSTSLILGGYGETPETLSHTIYTAQKYSSGSIYAFIGERLYPGTLLQKELSSNTCDFLYASPASQYIAPGMKPFLKKWQKDASPDKWSFIGQGILHEMRDEYCDV